MIFKADTNEILLMQKYTLVNSDLLALVVVECHKFLQELVNRIDEVVLFQINCTFQALMYQNVILQHILEVAK